MDDANMLVILLCIAPVHSLVLSGNKGHVPGAEAAQEIDVGDVVFTTPPPESDYFRNAAVAGPKAISPRAGILPNRQRVIVPVVRGHKAIRPFAEVIRPTGSNPLTSYAALAQSSSPYKKFHARKKYVHGLKKTAGNLHLGSKYVLPPSRYLSAPAVAYQAHTRGTPVRQVYHSVGDGPNIRDGRKFHNEKDAQHVKGNGRQAYPRKHSPPVHGGKSGAASSGHSHDEGMIPQHPDGEDGVTSEISTRHEEAADESAGGARRGDSKARGGDRVEFQMYGVNGPNSYKFGYDTGKGENRHFRFEERDNDGKITGHYGYVDDDGKTRIVKYQADPETGFRAGPVEYSSKQPRSELSEAKATGSS